MTNIRAKALAWVERRKKRHESIAEDVRGEGYPEIFEILDTIKESLSEPKWKSMESCPKEHGVRRLFLVNGEHYFGRWYNNKSYPRLSRWGIEHYDDLADQPTHWMPLPDAPTGGES